MRLSPIFNSIWPVPIGLLLAALVMTACFFRKRLFSCLKSKQNSVESGTYRRNSEFDSNTSNQGAISTTTVVEEFSNGLQDRRIEDWMLPNSNSAIRIISSPYDGTLVRGSTNQTTTSDQDSYSVEMPPPSYSSLFYCPPPKYEDVVVSAQWELTSGAREFLPRARGAIFISKNILLARYVYSFVSIDQSLNYFKKIVWPGLQFKEVICKFLLKRRTIGEAKLRSKGLLSDQRRVKEVKCEGSQDINISWWQVKYFLQHNSTSRDCKRLILFR